MSISYDIDPKTTAIVVIDMLNEFLVEGAQFECPTGRAMVPQLNELLATCRTANMPVIYIVETHREGMADRSLTAHILPNGASIHLANSWDVEVYEPLAPQPGDYVVEKRRHSAFFGTELELILRGLKVDTLIVTGVTSPVCCESTVRDALFRDLKVIYPRDLNECNDLPDVDGGSVPRDVVQRVVNSIIGFLYGEVTESGKVIDRIKEKASL